MIIMIVIIEEGRGDPIDESGGTEGKPVHEPRIININY